MLVAECLTMVMPVIVKGLTANSDGLYSLSDLDARFAEAMGEYEAIEDVPTAVRSASHSEAASHSAAIYNLQGQRLDTLQRGVNIIDGKKVVAN